jgi:O-antigen/teichoic acid export membrane protein
MRVKNALLNYSTGVGVSLISIILNFISRTVFVNFLGIEYLGINGLMMNVISMLSFAELGIGTAITFSLYKPIADNDIHKISLLMRFYRKTYHIIGVTVFVIGLVLMLFIDKIIKGSADIENLKIIFLIYLFNTSVSYFMTYKVTLVTASQKAYSLATTNLIFNIIIVTSQITIMIITQNFIFYLLSNLLIMILKTIYINFKVTNMYPYLKNKLKDKLDREEINKISSNVKAMIYHKIGDYCINGTDNIIISAFVSINAVGIYSNYAMVITSVNALIVIFFDSISSSMGNLIATETDEKKLDVFKIVNFIGFWIFGIVSVSFYSLLNPLIELWLGEKYLISQDILLIVILNFYLTGMRVPVGMVKSTAGLYQVDKFSPIYQSVINLVLSIIFVQKMGLMGVFLGTLISSIAIPCWQRPFLLYKYLFKTSSRQYFKDYFKYLLTVVGGTIITSFVINKPFFESVILNFIFGILICLLLPNLIFILIFHKSSEFNEILCIVKRLLYRRQRSE